MKTKRYSFKKQAQIQRRAFIIIFGLIIGLFGLFNTSINQANAVNHNETKILAIKVEKGDSLWTLADKYVGYSTVVNGVSYLKQLNQLESSVIYPGQTLLVPAINK